MKHLGYVLSFSLLFSLLSGCSKDDSSPAPEPAPEPDYSQCLLKTVNYPTGNNFPYYRDAFTLTYDSLKRIESRVAGFSFWLNSYFADKYITYFYINSVSPENLQSRYVYKLDGSNNNRISAYSTSLTGSTEDFTGQNRVVYEYDAAGYLTGQKHYTSINTLSQECTFTYQNGNLVQRINRHYNINNNPGTYRGADTLTYTYDTTAWFPEAKYLYEVTDTETGKPNKNNVTSIQLKQFDGTGGLRDYYKTIQYSYAVKAKRLEKVTMTATTVKGINLNSSFAFTYKCD